MSAEAIQRPPWLKEYKIFGIPETLEPYPDAPAYSQLDNAAKKFPKNGYVQFDYKITYPQAKDHAERLATALLDMGLQKGDRVATLLPTSIQFVVADFAIAKAGLVQIPSSSLEPVNILAHKFNEGSPRALICLDDKLEVVEAVLKETNIEKVILANLYDYSATPPESHAEVKIKNAMWMMDLIANTEPNLPVIEFDVEKDLELLLFTGGTTGLPKGCMLTHRNVIANAMQNGWALGSASSILKGCISVLLGLPFFHSYGHMIMHTMTNMGFEQILIPDARNTELMVSMIKKYYPVLQLGVPTQFLKMSDEELSNIGMLGISGSAPLPPSTQKKFEEKSGGGLMEGYGLSEMSPTTHLNTSLMIRLFGGRGRQKFVTGLGKLNGPLLNGMLRLSSPQKVGKVATWGIAKLLQFSRKKIASTGKTDEKRGTSGIPLPDTEVKLLDVETGSTLTFEEMREGKRGEMCLRGPQRMAGYWPTPGSGLDEEGYVRTGDVVTVDENGYFYIVDRTKDMINVSGYKVYSREIDDLLYGYPGVEHGAAVGVPDPEREGSERVAVYVQPKMGYREKISEEDIVEYLRSKIAKYAVPKLVKIIDEMPLTEVQKLDKKALRKRAADDFKKR